MVYEESMMPMVFLSLRPYLDPVEDRGTTMAKQPSGMSPGSIRMPRSTSTGTNLERFRSQGQWMS